MRRLGLYLGCAAAIALAAWLVVATVEPGAAPDVAAPPRIAAGSAPAAQPAPDPSRSALPQSPGSVPNAAATVARPEPEPAGDTLAAAPRREALSDDDPIRQLLDATWAVEAEDAGADPVHVAAPQRERLPETGTPTDPSDRSPAPTRRPTAMAPPIGFAPTSEPAPTRSEPDRITGVEPPPITPPRLTPPPAPQEHSFGSDSSGSDSGTSEGLSPSEIKSRIDPTLPEPVQERVYNDIANKSNQAAGWAN